MQEKIMYVCEFCADGNPEGCGHYDHTDLAVMPNGVWLCEDCASETDALADCGVVPGGEDGDEWPDFVDFQSPPEYGPPTTAHGTTIGITVFGAATLILAIAKLSGGVDWHWLWVLLPAWGPCAVAGLGFVGGLLQYAIRGR